MVYCVVYSNPRTFASIYIYIQSKNKRKLMYAIEPHFLWGSIEFSIRCLLLILYFSYEKVDCYC